MVASVSEEMNDRVQWVIRHGEQHIREVYAKVVAKGAKRPAVMITMRAHPIIAGINIDDDPEGETLQVIPIVIRDAEGRHVGVIGLDKTN